MMVSFRICLCAVGAVILVEEAVGVKLEMALRFFISSTLALLVTFLHEKWEGE